MAVPGDRIQLTGYAVTAQEAEAAILNYLRDYRGTPISMWAMLNTLCDHALRRDKRREKAFYLQQITRLIREQKVIRYRRNTNLPRGRPRIHSGLVRERLNWRGKIRISEAYA